MLDKKEPVYRGLEGQKGKPTLDEYPDHYWKNQAPKKREKSFNELLLDRLDGISVTLHQILSTLESK